MLCKGDYVSHNSFPPIEGYVSVIQQTNSGTPNIGVMQASGVLYWDDENTWDLVRANPIVEDSNGDSAVVIDADFS
jgi:hypothetical protein